MFSIYGSLLQRGTWGTVHSHLVSQKVHKSPVPLGTFIIISNSPLVRLGLYLEPLTQRMYPLLPHSFTLFPNSLD